MSQFINGIEIVDIVTDTSPQLGNSLDTNDFQIKWSKGADVASAAALPVLPDGNYYDVTGVAAITSINTMGIGTLITLHFDGILVLTHNATDLILPTGVNITTEVGDEAIFIEYDTGDWRCVNYSRASGGPIGTDDNYVTDAEKVVIGNTSGTNSGNENDTSIAAIIVGTADKATPVDADTVPLIDSADASSMKELSWSNIKATLKTYMDTLYDVLGGLTTHEADTSTHGVAQVANHAEIGSQISACPFMEYSITDDILHSHDADAESGVPAQSPVKVKTITLDKLYPSPSTIRIRFSVVRYVGVAGDSYGRIYKNEVALGTLRTVQPGPGTYTEDLEFEQGDTIDFYAWSQGSIEGTKIYDAKVLGVELAADPFSASNS